MKKTDDVPEIKTSLKNVPDIQHAFIYGSFAKNPEDHEHEVDIMVLGGPDLVEMDEMILNEEKKLGRPFSIFSLTVREFQERIKLKDETVLRALQGPKIMLLGSQEEMKAALDAQG